MVLRCDARGRFIEDIEATFETVGPIDIASVGEANRLVASSL